MATRAYIEDGYTEEGFIKEVPGIHEAVRFKFRPVLASKQRETLDRWHEIKSEVKSERINNLIKEQLVEWDLTFNKKLLPIETKILERLKQPVVDRIFNIITSTDKSDEDFKKVLKQREEDAKN